MTQLTEDRKSERKQGILFALPCATSAHLFAGAMANVSADGYVVPASDTAGESFLGVVKKEADNSSGANADVLCEGYLKGLFMMNTSGIAQADLVKEAYVVDDNTVGLGIAAQPANVTGVVLERTPLSTGGVHALAFTAAGTTLAWAGGTAVDVSSDGTYTLTATDGSTVKAAVTAASLPGADQSDNITLRHVGVGRIVEIVSAGTAFIEITDAARS